MLLIVDSNFDFLSMSMLYCIALLNPIELFIDILCPIGDRVSYTCIGANLKFLYIVIQNEQISLLVTTFMCELNWSIEEFSIVRMTFLVVLALHLLEVRIPSEFFSQYDLT